MRENRQVFPHNHRSGFLRSGSVIDPYGHVWHVATHKEDLSMDELRRRAAAQHKA